MREECFTHCIISTRAISTSAISINNAFSCYLQIFHSFIGHLRCFVAIFLVLIFLGLFCICAILIAFSISVREHTMGRELMDSIETEQLPILFPNGIRNITKQVMIAQARHVLSNLHRQSFAD